MNNIKTVELKENMFGYAKGVRLTRLSPDRDFELVSEKIADDYTVSNRLTVSPSFIDKDTFTAVEWFNPVKTNKQRIEELQLKLDTILKRIDTKIADYTKEYANIQDKLNSDLFSQDYEEYANEAMTVYKNMIDLLKKIKA